MAISITKPTVGGSEDTWGTTINTALDAIVDEINDNADGTNAINLKEGSFQIGGTAVTATAAELNIMDGVTATTAELNYVDGVTSNVQTQLDGKAELSGANFTGAVDVDATVTANSLAIDNGSNDWTFEVAANKLLIKYGGTAKMELDTSGNLTVIGNVTAYGTIS